MTRKNNTYRSTLVSTMSRCRGENIEMVIVDENALKMHSKN